MAPLLYKTDGSNPAGVVRSLAKIIGLELDLKQVDFDAKENKSPEYLKLNPVGQIPTLVDGDFVVTDSHAMVTYLLEKYGGSKAEELYPSDIRTRALINQALFFDTGVYFLSIRQVALPTAFEGLTSPPEKVLEDIETHYSVLEAWLQKFKYLAADHFTIADLVLGSTTFAVGTLKKLDAKKFPRTAEWASRLAQEDVFKTILIPTSNGLGAWYASTWEANKQKK